MIENHSVKPIDLFDIPLLRRLQRQGVQLDPKKSWTRPESPLSIALRAPLSVLEMPAYTYVARLMTAGGEQAGFVQLRCRGTDCTQADVTFISPALTPDMTRNQLWARLLDAVSWEVSCVGVQRVFASLPADSEDAVPFLNAGFMIFAREELLGIRSTPAHTDGHDAVLRPQQKADVWALQRLYAAITPLGVKQAEGLCGGDACPDDRSRWPDAGGRESYVLEVRGDLVGHVELTRGKAGNWIHYALHPDRPDEASELVDAGLQLLDERDPRPLFTNVRTYEDGVRPILEDRGFESLGRRDLAVRQTLARVKLTSLATVRMLERCREIPATPTLSRAKGQ